MAYRKKLFWLIFTATLIRLLFSAATELGNVEVYYWSWSIKPQWGYVDHPPIVAWMITLTTLGQLFVNEVAVRLGSVISAGIATLLIFKMGKHLQDEKTGWLAALLYTSCIYTSIGIGVYVLPDSPQIVFWLASLLVLLKLSCLNQSDKHYTIYWLAFGLLAGLCIMCKVHGVFIWLGAILYLLFNDRSQFKRIHLYFALLVTLVVISPIIFWNIEHHWYTWRFQSTRFTVQGEKIQWFRFGKQFTEVLFTIGPIHFFLIWSSVILYFRKRFLGINKQIQLLLLCNIPLIFFLLFVAVFRETYPHWPGPAYAGLLVLPAFLLRNRVKQKQANVPGVLKWAVAYCLVIALLQPLIINFFPGTSSIHQDGLEIGKDDVMVDMVGWAVAGKAFHDVYHNDLSKKEIGIEPPILVTTWTPASAIEFYIARKAGLRVIGVGSLDSLHQYYWMNTYKKPMKPGDDAYYIIPSNYFFLKVADGVTRHFETATNVLTVPVYRSQKLCKQFYIMRLRKYDGLPFQ